MRLEGEWPFALENKIEINCTREVGIWKIGSGMDERVMEKGVQAKRSSVGGWKNFGVRRRERMLKEVGRQ